MKLLIVAIVVRLSQYQTCGQSKSETLGDPTLIDFEDAPDGLIG
jgi:hypothetical protein